MNLAKIFALNLAEQRNSLAGILAVNLIKILAARNFSFRRESWQDFNFPGRIMTGFQPPGT